MQAKEMGLYKVTLEPVGKDRNYRQARVEAMSSEEAVQRVINLYASNRQGRKYSAGLRKSVDQVGIAQTFLEDTSEIWAAAEVQQASELFEVHEVIEMKAPIFFSEDELQAKRDRSSELKAKFAAIRAERSKR